MLQLLSVVVTEMNSFKIASASELLQTTYTIVVRNEGREGRKREREREREGGRSR